MAIVGSALAPIVLPLVFGADFTPSVRMAQVLFGAGILSAVGSITGAGLLSVGRPTARSVGQVAGLVVNVAMLALLVPALGAIGAAWATVGAYAVMAAVSVWQFRRLTGISARACLLTTPDDLRFIRQLPRRLRARRA
jgi:O-antigen/teichoic acid export membrane protein